jgi:hypothetical protein
MDWNVLTQQVESTEIILQFILFSNQGESSRLPKNWAYEFLSYEISISHG